MTPMTNLAALLLIGVALLAPATAAANTAPGDGPVALLTDEECWKRMPPAASGGGQPLPSWAKAVATRLPRTAAAMLELDLAQRTKSPLDPVLRAKMRWVIAHANRCAYSEAYALADLKRAGGDDAAIKALTGDPAGWPEADREPLEFARLLPLDAPTIPDELFARLRERFGDKRVAAMVLLGGLRQLPGPDRARARTSRSSPAARLPPLEVKFAPGAFQSAPILPPQPRASPPARRRARRSSSAIRSGRSCRTRSCSRGSSGSGRGPRACPIPSWDEVKKNLPPAFASRPTRIVWNLVCSGYVPELAIPWSVSTRTMWAEARPGPRLRGEPVLGPDPQHPLQLLHGPLRDAAGGRRARQGRPSPSAPAGWPATTGRPSRRPSSGPMPTPGS